MAFSLLQANLPLPLSFKIKKLLHGSFKKYLFGCVFAACGFSCSLTCGVLVARPGFEPLSPAVEGEVLTPGLPPSYEDAGDCI